MREGKEGAVGGPMPLAYAIELCLAAQQEGKLYPKDAYDSLYYHACDRDLTPELLLWEASQDEFSAPEQAVTE